jgi:hypothetical protein
LAPSTTTTGSASSAVVAASTLPPSTNRIPSEHLLVVESLLYCRFQIVSLGVCMVTIKYVSGSYIRLYTLLKVSVQFVLL